MLAGQGVEDADERVLHQLMDFTHRESACSHTRSRSIVFINDRDCDRLAPGYIGYTTDLLTDAKTYANHAGRPGVVETTDVELAVQTRSGYEFTEGAPKDVSLLAKTHPVFITDHRQTRLKLNIDVLTRSHVSVPPPASQATQPSPAPYLLPIIHPHPPPPA